MWTIGLGHAHACDAFNSRGTLLLLWITFYRWGGGRGDLRPHHHPQPVPDGARLLHAAPAAAPPAATPALRGPPAGGRPEVAARPRRCAGSRAAAAVAQPGAGDLAAPEHAVLAPRQASVHSKQLAMIFPQWPSRAFLLRGPLEGASSSSPWTAVLVLPAHLTAQVRVADIPGVGQLPVWRGLLLLSQVQGSLIHTL